jgi:hypothetical protein
MPAAGSRFNRSMHMPTPYFYDYTPSCAAIPINHKGESFAKYRLDKQRGSLLKRRSRGAVVTQKAAEQRPDFS